MTPGTSLTMRRIRGGVRLSGVQEGVSMTDNILKRFAHGLSAASQLRLKELVAHRRHLRPREDILRQGETPDTAYFVLEGFVCRYKLLSGGRRAALAYLLPGDFC